MLVFKVFISVLLNGTRNDILLYVLYDEKQERFDDDDDIQIIIIIKYDTKNLFLHGTVFLERIINE